ncbi:thiamine pyrophosphate-dependent enzyme [Desulfosporosinus sp.]|uniref:thiamine pyrophosphate-dependent enzyme n=1 Tax=Desulfosporosinus sp. TaxID=157907 RepID=UPI0025C06DDE|nr:thiamine pyrophosphate-dependent enzyme [Desulfosporosinus sp.]MBC2722061.1 pyruvate synthase subunit beta [Desulfosporosinus sp.]MBC2725920.1 pyruvate synthase subunit beta [Desulfosporosinus sp.]
MGYQINEEKVFNSGHAACPGCSEALAMRYIVNTLGPDTIGVVPPSCIAIISGPQPLSSMRMPVYQTTLEASAASATGIARALKAKGNDHTKVVAIAGDGGTYDIGFQSLSSAAERNEDFIYICLDNEGYMNTGAQKSSSTPYLAYTASTPAGKPTPKKNLAEIMAAHRIPYMATATTGYPEDLARKVAKAKEIRGLRFIVVLTPCLDGWGLADNAGPKVSRLAVETGVFPLYEVENGDHYTLNYGSKGTPINQYLSLQKRYRHLNQAQIEEIQIEVNKNWQRLHRKFST